MTKKRCVLVSCTNGLGHARRLMHYGSRWSLEIDIELLVNLRQYLQLSEELESLERGNIVLTVIPDLGPHVKNPTRWNTNYSSVSPLIRKKIAEAEYVMMDNVFWPLLFNKDAIFLGHFSWVDLFKDTQGPVRDSNIVLDQINRERSLLEQCRRAILVQPFAFGQVKFLPIKFNINLPRMLKNFTDSRYVVPRFLVSLGTTGQGQVVLKDLQEKFVGLEHAFAETYNLNKLTFRPLFVVGRPGLGTIRDCAEHQISFYPISVSDSELKNNVSTLEKHSRSFASLPGVLKIDPNILEDTPLWAEVEKAILVD